MELLSLVVAGGSLVAFLSYPYLDRFRLRATTNRSWAAAAEELNLEFEPADKSNPSPVLNGMIDGVKVRVATITTGSGTARRTWRTFTMWIPQSAPPGRLRQRARSSDWSERHVMRTEDWWTGEKNFDLLVVLDSIRAEREQWRKYLTPGRRAAIRNLFEQWDSVVIDNGEINVGYGPGHTSAGMVEEVRSIVREVAVLGRFPDRADPGQDEWSLADTVAKWEAVPSAAPVASPDVTSQSETTAVGHLFGARLSSRDAESRFAAHWQGHEVTWAGKVVSATPYGHDADFGAGPGVGVVATIGYIDGMRLISNQVDAVVEIEGSSTVRPGQQFYFGGTLMKINHSARQLYVADAASTTI